MNNIMDSEYERDLRRREKQMEHMIREATLQSGRVYNPHRPYRPTPAEKPVRQCPHCGGVLTD